MDDELDLELEAVEVFSHCTNQSRAPKIKRVIAEWIEEMPKIYDTISRFPKVKHQPQEAQGQTMIDLGDYSIRDWTAMHQSECAAFMNHPPRVAFVRPAGSGLKLTREVLLTGPKPLNPDDIKSHYWYKDPWIDTAATEVYVPKTTRDLRAVFVYDLFSGEQKHVISMDPSKIYETKFKKKDKIIGRYYSVLGGNMVFMTGGALYTIHRNSTKAVKLADLKDCSTYNEVFGRSLSLLPVENYQALLLFYKSQEDYKNIHAWRIEASPEEGANVVLKSKNAISGEYAAFVPLKSLCLLLGYRYSPCLSCSLFNPKTLQICQVIKGEIVHIGYSGYEHQYFIMGNIEYVYLGLAVNKKDEGCWWKYDFAGKIVLVAIHKGKGHPIVAPMTGCPEINSIDCFLGKRASGRQLFGLARREFTNPKTDRVFTSPWVIRFRFN